MSKLVTLRKALRAAILLEAKLWQQLETMRTLQRTLARQIVLIEKGGSATIYDLEHGVARTLRAAGLTQRACYAPTRYVVEDEKLQTDKESVQS